MARIYGIKKSLTENGFDDKTIKEIAAGGNLVDVIGRMEKTLDADTMHQILDRHGCGGGKEYCDRLRKIGKEIADKTLNEKIDHINSVSPDSEQIVLNADNTLTATWSFDDNGKYKCLCSAAVKNGVKVSDLVAGDCAMPLTYCFCCAGSGRRHLQLQLGVELKTREIISSPINSRGEKPCKLIFEIV